MCAPLLLATLGAAAGCEIKRPRGAYEGADLFDDDKGYDGSVDTTDDSGVAVPIDTPDSTVPSDGGDSVDPRLALQGDYLVRFDSQTRVDHVQLGRVTTQARSYGVMRLRLEGDKLMGTEWLCSSKTLREEASKGTIRTTVSNTIWNEFSPVQRAFDIDLEAGTFETSEAERRQGWKVSADRMPTDPNQTPDDFVDHDKDGQPGIKTRIQAEATAIVIPVDADCEYHVVSFTRSRYHQGKLDGSGLPSDAQVDVSGADVHAWRARRLGGDTSCSVDDINDAAKPTVEEDRVRFSRLDAPLTVTEANPKPCPDPKTFDQTQW